MNQSVLDSYSNFSSVKTTEVYCLINNNKTLISTGVIYLFKRDNNIIIYRF